MKVLPSHCVLLRTQVCTTGLDFLAHNLILEPWSPEARVAPLRYDDVAVRELLPVPGVQHVLERQLLQVLEGDSGSRGLQHGAEHVAVQAVAAHGAHAALAVRAAPSVEPWSGVRRLRGMSDMRSGVSDVPVVTVHDGFQGLGTSAAGVGHRIQEPGSALTLPLLAAPAVVLGRASSGRGLEVALGEKGWRRLAHDCLLQEAQHLVLLLRPRQLFLLLTPGEPSCFSNAFVCRAISSWHEV